MTQTLIELNRNGAVELWQAVFPEGVFDELRGFLSRVHPKLLSEVAFHRVVQPKAGPEFSRALQAKESGARAF